jgi:hypothetical protein
MWRQAGGTRPPGPSKGQWALPCGMQSGLLCAVCAVLGLMSSVCPHPSMLVPRILLLVPFPFGLQPVPLVCT